MAMDFFEHQERARKRTGLLVFFFLLAVLGIMVLVYLAVAVFIGAMGARSENFDGSMLYDWRLIVGVGAGVAGVVALGSMYKIASLAGGGHVVAEMLGGRLIEPGTRVAHERMVLNVVEEMAIAAGTAVPPVFILENEEAINAFAAGFAPSSAVVTVTRGCVEKLSRDELQGVIGHEFSHILNGDMRLNIRLIGVVYGILVIGLIGWGIVRSLRFSGGGSSRRDGKGGGGAIVAILMLGVSLMVIGFVGTFFGKLIKAAVSRQREFLADASSVQFTRNPDGIADALKKIGGYTRGSLMQNHKAEEVSHMLFSQGFSGFLGELFATHPPLAERIRRIDPSFDGQMIEIDEGYMAPVEAEGLAEGVSGLAAAPPPRRPAPPPLPPARPAASAVEQFGQPTQAHIDYARALIDAVPVRVRNAARETYGARAVIYCLLLDERDDVKRVQLERLRQFAQTDVYRLTMLLDPLVKATDRSARLPLIDLALPALWQMSADQYASFKDNVAALIKADGRVDLFEWVLHRVLTHHLGPFFEKKPAPAAKYRSLSAVRDQAVTLLATLAYAGQDGQPDARRAFDLGAQHLDLGQLDMPPSDRCGLRAVDQALETLNQLTAPPKRSLLKACATTIAADRQVTEREAELFRAIADSLDCPVPPLLPGQPLV
jgi:Zn-dependent protease with chaperone function